MWNNILQMLNDPHARHAAAVHLPIALGILGVPLALLILIARSKSLSIKWFALACFLLCSLGSALAANAGEEAEDALSDLSSVEESFVSRHEELGENGWAWPLIPATLVSISLLARKHRPVVVSADVLTLLASFAVATWIAITAHAGGELVYLHGIGVPARAGVLESDSTQTSTTTTPKRQEKSDDH